MRQGHVPFRRHVGQAEVTGFFDAATNTISYVVKDPSSEVCAIVDSVMDIDHAAGRISCNHADHLSAAHYI